MSRTYRRKGNSSRPTYLYSDPKWFTHEYRKIDGVNQHVELEGDELIKSMNRYHSDKNVTWTYSWWLRNRFESKLRMKSKQEISKFFKDPESYEVIPHKKPCLSFEL